MNNFTFYSPTYFVRVLKMRLDSMLVDLVEVRFLFIMEEVLLKDQVFLIG